MGAARAALPRGGGAQLSGCARSFQGSLAHGVYHRILGTWRTAKAAFRPLALDPPLLQTPPNRGPRTPGLRRKHLKDPLKSPFRQSPFHNHPVLEGPRADHGTVSAPSRGSTPLSPISWRAPSGPLFSSEGALGGSSASFPRFLSRTEAGPSRSCRGAFRSPRPSSKTGQADGITEDSLLLDIEKLKEKRELLDKEISQLVSEGYSVDELEDHISQLHEYNDIKDVGQMLLGKLAVIRGVTTKELYLEFGLDVND